MPQQNINVKADFNGMTVRNGAWVGTPAITFDPNDLHVQNGNNLITWTLQPSNTPAGYTPAFPSSNAIVFKGPPQYPNYPTWTGGAPVLQGDGTVQASDNFQGLAAAVKYYYSATVGLTPNAGTSGGVAGSWTQDPDIENEPG